MDEVYVELRKKMDTLGFGYPESRQGFEYPLLTALFDPEEARIFCAMPNGYHTAEAIADILGEPVEEVAAKLESMSLRGNLFRIRKADETVYRTVPVVHGIYEFSIPRIDVSWVQPMVGHLMQGGWGQQVYGTDTPLLRSIPASGTIEAGTQILPVDNVDELIRSKEKIAVAPCLCRVAMEMVGAPKCTHPSETCFAFDEFAEYYVENGIARYITTEEALEIVHKGSEEGLVAQVGTSKRGEVLCNCCPCCCAVMTSLKVFGGPASKVATNYYAVNDADACTQCGACAEKCPMEVIDLSGEIMVIDIERCIGCGNCAVACPADAMIIRRKDEAQVYDPPAATIFDSYSLQQQYRGFPE